MHTFMKRKRVPSGFWPIRGSRSKFEDELYCVESQHRYLILKWLIDRASVIPRIELKTREKDWTLRPVFSCTSQLPPKNAPSLELRSEDLRCLIQLTALDRSDQPRRAENEGAGVITEHSKQEKNHAA